MQSKILNRSAVQIPSTLNPSINRSASKIIKALIINKNKPKDKIVTGKVSITKIGLTNALSIDRTTATKMEVI